MTKKIIKFIGHLLLSVVCLVAIALFECYEIKWASALVGVLLSFFVASTITAFIDISDVNDWQTSLRKHLRGGFLKNTDLIRISFAYLFRIKVNGKYLLVLNHRDFNKFQPVGGVYQCFDEEKQILKSRRYCVCDDDSMPIDESSKMDYRMRLPAGKLKKFVRRFEKTDKRECISNVSREFREELLASKILDDTKFKKIKYRVCGRHCKEITYSNHFRCYELILADIVEFIPDSIQEAELIKHQATTSKNYMWAVEQEIESLGIDKTKRIYTETITQHSYKILDTKTQELTKLKSSNEIYEVSI